MPRADSAAFFAYVLDPSLLLFDGLWRQALAYVAPTILRALVARSTMHYRRNVMAIHLLFFENRRCFYGSLTEPVLMA